MKLTLTCPSVSESARLFEFCGTFEIPEDTECIYDEKTHTLEFSTFLLRGTLKKLMHPVAICESVDGCFVIVCIASEKICFDTKPLFKLKKE